MIEIIIMVIFCICMITKVNVLERRIDYLEAEALQRRIKDIREKKDDR